jgi:hypothetical protein
MRAAETIGYDYLAVTDHTPAVRVAGGMDRAGFRRQMKRVEELNRSLRHLTVLAGAEVDIQRNGRLDLDDDTLDALDFVVVSLHSGFRLGETEQTARLRRALSHPGVDVFGLLSLSPPLSGPLRLLLFLLPGSIASQAARPRRRRIGPRSSWGSSRWALAPRPRCAMRWGVNQARRGERAGRYRLPPPGQLRKLLRPR